jgi:predicted transcriptional regulator
VQRAPRYVRGPQFRPEAQVASMTPDGRELYVRRVEAGLSIRALAHKTGVDVSYLSMIENGHRNLSPRMRERLKAVLL